ncbi:hypothetical protein Tcan_01204, partial [Toxocara canis]
MSPLLPSVVSDITQMGFLKNNFLAAHDHPVLQYRATTPKRTRFLSSFLSLLTHRCESETYWSVKHCIALPYLVLVWPQTDSVPFQRFDEQTKASITIKRRVQKSYGSGIRVLLPDQM